MIQEEFIAESLNKEAKNPEPEEKEKEFEVLSFQTASAHEKRVVEPVIAMDEEVVTEDTTNNNDLILKMHKQGKSNVAIAKELGLGVGEVNLVIDLFEVM